MPAVVASDVAWIDPVRAAGGTLRYAIPADFEVYGVLDLGYADDATEDDLLDALAPHDSDQLIAGWIDRGPWPVPPGDVHVLYYGWNYSFRQLTAAELRGLPPEGEGSFPDLVFPLDRSWMVSLLWDDAWRSVGADEATARRVRDRLPSFERLGPDTDLASTGRSPN